MSRRDDYEERYDSRYAWLEEWHAANIDAGEQALIAQRIAEQKRLDRERALRYDPIEEAPPRPMTRALGLDVDTLPEKEGW